MTGAVTGSGLFLHCSYATLACEGLVMVHSRLRIDFADKSGVHQTFHQTFQCSLFEAILIESGLTGQVLPG